MNETYNSILGLGKNLGRFARNQKSAQKRNTNTVYGHMYVEFRKTVKMVMQGSKRDTCNLSQF